MPCTTQRQNIHEKKKKRSKSRGSGGNGLLMRCRQKVGTSPVPAAPCSHPPPIAPSVSARGCPGLMRGSILSLQRQPSLFFSPNRPPRAQFPIPPVSLPPPPRNRNPFFSRLEPSSTYTAPHRYSRLSRASASLPWPLHVIPSADTKIEIHPSNTSPRTKRPTEPRLIRVSCRNWARLERPHISTAVI